MSIASPVLLSSLGSNASEPSEGEVGEVCIANISPRERKMRMSFGIVQFVIGVVVLAALVAFDANPLWRLSLLFLFGAAATGYFQAKDKT